MTLPDVPSDFYWTQQPWGAALRCRPLAPIAQHLFTTRQLELPSDAAWNSLAQTIGVSVAAVVSLNQVHGRDVIVVDAAVPSERPRADAMVSDAPEVALVVRAADCVPLLMGDRRTGAVGAVHAGWRGTAARVAVAAVDAM